MMFKVLNKVNQHRVHAPAWPHLLFHLEPILRKHSTFSRLELPAALLQVSNPSPFCPPSLVIPLFLCLSRCDWAWAMAGGSAPILTPQDYHHLGLDHYEGLGIILVHCWPQVKLLVLPTTSHGPGSSSKECCGKKWVWLPTKLTSLVF